ncbi:MAG: methyltransferase domain-containing protein [Acidimicrobiia bacterium]|nr:methyltransferase domain-containing protein [Acidimicrobiia bacterium]
MATESALHPLVRRLAEERHLRCPRCGRTQVEVDGNGLRCGACAATFPAYNRVVDLHGLVMGPPSSDEDLARAVALAEPVAKALDLPDAGEVLATVTEVLGRTASMSAHHDEFDAEIRDIADRFGIDTGVEPEPPSALGALLPAPARVDLEVERHYIPARLPPSTRLTGNVRFRNRGSEAFSSYSSPPVTVGFRWYDERGEVVAVPEHRTRFPIAMPPGRAVTLPVDFETPGAEGTYTLVVCPVIEERCWVPTSGVAVQVTVGPAPGLPSSLDLRPDAEPLTYADDHAAALRLLEAQAASLLTTPDRKILEVGGAGAPQVSWFGPHDAVNVDINLPLLELGSLWYEHNADDAVSERLAFLCADATDLPFESETFDVVAMFATLHHFPAPEVLLRECRRLVRPDGIVAVLCEPVGGSLEDTDTLRDLVKGINEQVFTVTEYVAIFAAAGLEVVSGTQVGGSLRVFLRRAEPSGASFTDVVPVPPRLLGGRPTASDVVRKIRSRLRKSDG